MRGLQTPTPGNSLNRTAIRFAPGNAAAAAVALSAAAAALFAAGADSAAASAAAAALSAAYCPGTMGGGRRFRNRGGKHRAYYKEKAKQEKNRPTPGKSHPGYAAPAAWHKDRAANRG